MNAKEFQEKLLDWFDQHGRKELPWRQQPAPYRVWVSEIMLQQTRVSTVIPYYQKFTARFPAVETLASAPLDEVLHLWSGLGYYARARNLHEAARIVAGLRAFPSSVDDLCALPGIGKSTAGAILSIAFGQRQPILDGNVRRVLIRFQAVDGWPGDARVERELWQLSEAYTPKKRVADYTQAIMDLGAALCTRSQPGCRRCPVQTGCRAFHGGRVGELPAPRPKKRIPARKSFLLVITDAREQLFYLERRPAGGLWGGLWSFPEYSEKAEVEYTCRLRGIDPLSLRWLPERRHTFTHFHLDYTPVVAPLENPINLVMEGIRSLWYKAGLDERYGLPAPVTRLIAQLSNDKL